MPVKLIGPKVKFTGKTLWEICGNLKNLGVGRIVIKSHFLNYPEISYFKLVNVQPVLPPSDKHADRKVMVWAEHVFRGNKYPELVQMHNLTDRTTFQLIPRTEEDKYLKVELSKRVNEVPQYRELPPLLKIFLEREARILNKPVMPMKTCVVTNANAFAVIRNDKTTMKNIPPSLWVTPVAQLKEKLEKLKENVSAAPTST